MNDLKIHLFFADYKKKPIYGARLNVSTNLNKIRVNSYMYHLTTIVVKSEKGIPYDF